jgi:LL-diaminopimelate aminotransferase
MIIKEANRLNTVAEYYFSKKLTELKLLETVGKKIINLGVGSPDMGPSIETVTALIESAQQADNHGYQSYRGTNELRVAISRFYANTYNVDVQSQSELLPLMGSKEGIMHISMAFLNDGDKVLIPNPGYPTYTSVTNLVGAEPVYYDLLEENNWQLDIEQLKTFDLDQVKIMWLNTPHMPTGAELDTTILKQLIELAKSHNFLICCDNPYSLVLTESTSSILSIEGAKEVVVELNSLSKSHNMAGWRVGWVAGAKEYINTILKVKSNMDSGMLLPVQHAAIAALNNSEEWHFERNEVYATRKVKAQELFDLLNCTYSNKQVGMFLWAKVNKDIVEVEEWVDLLIDRAGVFITPGFIFGSNGNRYVRISLCSSVEVLEEAIIKIKAII